MDVGASAAQGQFILVAVAYVCLTWAFVERDWSVVYVAANAHSQLPLIYRISAVWGAHEGSMLLWMLMLTGWGAAVSVFSRSLPRDVRAQALAVLGARVGERIGVPITSSLIGQRISIRGIPFEVIGVLQSKGSTGFQNPDDEVYIPLSTAQLVPYDVDGRPEDDGQACGPAYWLVRA